jgi:hypothetical protein
MSSAKSLDQVHDLLHFTDRVADPEAEMRA